MATDIFYFSGTGNTLKTARDIANELGGVKIIPIPEAVSSNETASGADTIGIMFPVYMFGMPLIVADFVKKLKAGKGAYIFAVATYGGLMGSAIRQCNGILKANGLKLSAGFGVIMPGNYTPLYEAIPEDKQKARFVKEEARARDIAAIVKERKETPLETNNFLVNLLFSGLIYNLGSRFVRSEAKGFWTNDRCDSCGTCEKVCPVSNIKIVDGRPRWLDHCEQCLACLQWCPKEAIEFRKSTIGRRRYRNPDVKVEDFIRDKW